MGKAPAFQFYVKDWLSDPALQAASASTRGIWINALCYMWEAPLRGELQGTPEGLGRMLGATHKEFITFIEEMTALGIGEVDIRKGQKRVATLGSNPGSVTGCNEIVTLQNRRMVRYRQTTEGTRKRVAKHRAKAAGLFESNTDVTVPSSSSSPSPGTKVPYSVAFEEFWKAYPRKIKKAKAWDSWRKQKLDPRLEEILEGLRRWSRSKQWTKDRGEFIPHPATWLNAHQWEDEVDGQGGENPYAQFD